MPFNNNRNSRDDKSGKDSKKSDRSDSSSRSNSDNKSFKSSSNYKKKDDSSFSSDRKPYGDKRENSSDRKAPYGSRPAQKDGDFRDKKPYGTRSESSFSDRKPYGSRSEGSSSDRNSYGSRSENSSSDRKPYGSRSENSSSDRKPYGSRGEGSSSDRKPYGSRSENSSSDRKPYGSRGEGSSSDRKPYGSRSEGSSFGEKKSYGPRNESSSNDKKPYGTRSENSYGDKKPFKGKSDSSSPERKPFAKREDRNSFEDRKAYGDRKPSFRKRNDEGEDRKPFVSSDKSFKPREGDFEGKSERTYGKRPERKSFDKENTPYDDDQVKLRAKPNAPKEFKKDGELIRLNRFISNAGICSRRKADEIIAAGVVTVNGEAVSELGTKINPAKDLIRYNGELLKREKMIYVLLNKPKDYITTTDDPQERKTVMELVDKASKERIYPVGRLDRNTTGLLLLTNDGDLADKLSHPKNSISKIYNVELSRNLTQGDFNKIAFGIELEDGFIKPDDLRYVTGGAKNEIGIQIHSGKNRIVRRVFESLGYEVEKLDRVIYANLTKKDLTRGRWRYLTDQEIIQLKHFTKA
jgi:23S rRNA pseudouridine2605 synthase